MKINNARSHCIVTQVHFGASVNDEPCSFLAVTRLNLVGYTVLGRGGAMQFIFVEIPKGHGHCARVCENEKILEKNER